MRLSGRQARRELELDFHAFPSPGSAAIDGLNAAAVGLIGASVVFLARDAFMPAGSADLVTVAIGGVAFAFLLGGRVGPVPLLLSGAVAGFVAQAVRA